MNANEIDVTSSAGRKALGARCGQAASLTEQWMLQHLEQEDLEHRDIPDPVVYYKWPLTLAARGRMEEGRRLLLWVAEKSLVDSGDLASQRSGFHLEFHTYANLWLVLGAIQLEASDLAETMLRFLRENQNGSTGGVKAVPGPDDTTTEDPLSTSFMGMAACDLKDQKLADRCLAYLGSLLDAQPREDTFYLRTMANGSLVTTVPDGQDPQTHFLKIGQPDECYYFLGAMCFFLARYTKTFGTTEAVASAIDRVTAIVRRVGKESLGTIWAAKVGPGMTALYAATGDAGHLEWAAPVIEAVLGGQTEEGYWLKSGKPWVTVSAEQCYWLTFISNALGAPGRS